MWNILDFDSLIEAVNMAKETNPKDRTEAQKHLLNFWNNTPSYNDLFNRKESK